MCYALAFTTVRMGEGKLHIPLLEINNRALKVRNHLHFPYFGALSFQV